MSENAAADVEETPGVEPGRIGLQRTEQRVTARMHRTEAGEVVTEYRIGGRTFRRR